MNDSRLAKILCQSDRDGERAIALFQALIATIVVAMHLVSASANEWRTLSGFTIVIACLILAFCALRLRLSGNPDRHDRALQALTVGDGLLIFGLILSYSSAYHLPVQAAFKTPSLVFLALYTGIRVLRFDPRPVLVAGVTVLAGWGGLIAATLLSGAIMTRSYPDYLVTHAFLPGAAAELAAGFAALVLALAVAMTKARSILTASFHLDDLREAKLLAEANSESERRARAQFEQTVDASMDAIVVIGEDGRITGFNPAAESIFGYSRQEALGRDMSALIVPDQHRERHAQGMKRYLETGEGAVLGRRIELPAMRKGGETFDVELAITTVDGPDGPRFIGYARDITDRKQAEEQLKAEKERAEFANRTKASFLAMMSHEVRTPLNGLMGVVELLDETELDEEQRDYVDIARHSCSAMLQIINEILDFSKLEAGKMTIEERRYDPAAILDGVAQLVKPLASRKGLQIEASVAPGFPAHVVGDPGRVRQIVLNLASNAVKFTERGRVTISARTCETDGGQALLFEVADTGVGIAPDKRHLVFQEFNTVGNGQPGAGTGLGLAICKRLAAAMGGEIEFESEVGKGSCFRVRLPLVSASRTAEKLEPAYGAARQGCAFLGMRILVAEDNASNQIVLRRHLEQLGAGVDVVSDGLAAVEAVRSGGYDAVLMDVSIPRLDGLAATRRIRASGAAGRVPVVMITGHTMEADRIAAVEAGATAHLGKPVSRDELARTLTRIFAQAHAQEPAPNPVVEDAALAEILEGFEEAERKMFLDQFAADIGAQSERAVQAARENDFETLEKATHSLKGVAGMIGGRALQMHAADLNDRLRLGVVEVGDAEIEELSVRAAALLGELARWTAPARSQAA